MRGQTLKRVISSRCYGDFSIFLFYIRFLGSQLFYMLVQQSRSGRVGFQ